jgi:hypothetical protein
LSAFYQKHAPHKIQNIDTLLEMYAGREGQLYEDLVQKYNARLPHSETKKKSVVKAVVGSIGTLATTMVSTFKPGNVPVTREELVEFYERHDPDKLSNIPDILLGFSNQHARLRAELAKKYGEAPGNMPAMQASKQLSPSLARYINGNASGPTSPSSAAATSTRIGDITSSLALQASKQVTWTIGKLEGAGRSTQASLQHGTGRVMWGVSRTTERLNGLTVRMKERES